MIYADETVLFLQKILAFWSFYFSVFRCQQTSMEMITSTKLGSYVSQVRAPCKQFISSPPLLIISQQSLSQNVTTSIRPPIAPLWLPVTLSSSGKRWFLLSSFSPTYRCDQTRTPFEAYSCSTYRGVWFIINLRQVNEELGGSSRMCCL